MERESALFPTGAGVVARGIANACPLGWWLLSAGCRCQGHICSGRGGTSG